jgi:hypothetical protein
MKALCSNDTDNDSGKDRDQVIFKELGKDFVHAPYFNPQFDQDPTAVLDTRNTFAIVWIEDFFTDGRDFMYYVIGKQHITNFLTGMFGSRPYNGPLAATPVLINEPHVLTIRGPGIDIENYARVERRSAKMEEVKWLYLFNTAVVAWNKLRVHPRKVENIRHMNGLAIMHHRARKAAQIAAQRAAQKAAKKASLIARIPTWGSGSDSRPDDETGQDADKKPAQTAIKDTSQIPLRAKHDSPMEHHMVVYGSDDMTCQAALKLVDDAADTAPQSIAQRHILGGRHDSIAEDDVDAEGSDDEMYQAAG